jgi:hypothetical protein
MAQGPAPGADGGGVAREGTRRRGRPNGLLVKAVRIPEQDAAGRVAVTV